MRTNEVYSGTGALQPYVREEVAILVGRRRPSERRCTPQQTPKTSFLFFARPKTSLPLMAKVDIGIWMPVCDAVEGGNELDA